jgi:hypothetical protein
MILQLPMCALYSSWPSAMSASLWSIVVRPIWWIASKFRWWNAWNLPTCMDWRVWRFVFAKISLVLSFRKKSQKDVSQFSLEKTWILEDGNISYGVCLNQIFFIFTAESAAEFWGDRSFGIILGRQTKLLQELDSWFTEWMNCKINLA